jgi:hypothetical protein
MLTGKFRLTSWTVCYEPITPSPARSTQQPVQPELDAFRCTARRLLTIVEQVEPRRRLSIVQDRRGRIGVADVPTDFKPGAGPPIVIGFKPGLSQRKKVELAMVHELLAEVFVGLSNAEANELAAAITVYTRADKRKNGKPITPGAIKKQRQRQRRG